MSTVGTNQQSGSNRTSVVSNNNGVIIESFAADTVTIENTRVEGCKIVTFETPELLDPKCTRDPMYLTYKLINLSATTTMKSVVDKLDLAKLYEAKVEWEKYKPLPFDVYREGENYQLVYRALSHFTRLSDDKDLEAINKEVHAVTNNKYRESSTNFPTVVYFYIMLKEEVLIESIEQFLKSGVDNIAAAAQTTTDSTTNSLLFRLTKFALLAVRCNLVNKNFASLFLSHKVYQSLLKFLHAHQLLTVDNYYLLFEYVEIIRILLVRSLKYNSNKHLDKIKMPNQSPRSSTQRNSAQRHSSSSDNIEPFYKEEDVKAFEDFKSDTTFWENLVVNLLSCDAISSCPSLVEAGAGNNLKEIWSQSDAYCVVELLLYIIQLNSVEWSKSIVESLFKTIQTSFASFRSPSGRFTVDLQSYRESREVQNSVEVNVPCAPGGVGGADVTSQIATPDVVTSSPNYSEAREKEDKTLTMCLRLIQLAINATKKWKGKFIVDPETPPKKDLALSRLYEFVSNQKVTLLLFNDDFKKRDAIFYPYTKFLALLNPKSAPDASSLPASPILAHASPAVGGGVGGAGGKPPSKPTKPVAKMYTKCFYFNTQLYFLAFEYFYTDDIKVLRNFNDQESNPLRKLEEKLMGAFRKQIRSLNLNYEEDDCVSSSSAADNGFLDQNESADYEERIKQIFDFHSLKQQEYVRLIHYKALEYFIAQASHITLSKLCNMHREPVPLVKAAYYTIEFVLKMLELNALDGEIGVAAADGGFGGQGRVNGTLTPAGANNIHRTSSQLQQMNSNFNKMSSFPLLTSSSSYVADDGGLGGCTRMALYSYFFSTVTVPHQNDLYEMITRFLENFINTFLNGRPTDYDKHFFKVVAFERSVIERTCGIIMMRTPAKTVNEQQYKNSKEFLDKIVYDKAFELPSKVMLLPAVSSPSELRLRSECKREAKLVCQEQCLNYFTSNKLSFKFKEDSDPSDYGHIHLNLSRDRKTIEYKKISNLKSDKAGKLVEIEYSVLIKSCTFSLSSTKDRSVELKIQPDNEGSAITLLEDLSSKDSGGGGNLIYFYECLRIILESDTQRPDKQRISINMDKSEIEKNQRVIQRTTLEKKIEDILYKTKTFPLTCLPPLPRYSENSDNPNLTSTASSSASAPPLPPMPHSLPSLLCKNINSSSTSSLVDL